MSTYVIVIIVHMQPRAGGSGFRRIKSFLNGTRVLYPERIKVLLVRLLGISFVTASGLAVGIVSSYSRIRGFQNTQL